MLVTVKTNAVAEPVGEEFVVWAVACAGDDGTGGVIYCAGEASGARGVKSCVLRFADEFECA